MCNSKLCATMIQRSKSMYFRVLLTQPNVDQRVVKFVKMMS